MGEMVERVARAILRATTRLDGDPVSVHLSWSMALENCDAEATEAGMMSICEDAAQAAIEAMRRPLSDAMIEASAKLRIAGCYDGMRETDAILASVIDAALNEPP